MRRSWSGIERVVAAVRRQGIVVQLGLQTSPVEVNLLEWVFKDIIVRGSICYPSDSWPRVMAMIGSGDFPVEKIVTSVVALEDTISRGFAPLLDPAGDELKVLLRVGAEE